jgi:hypothetical protein
VKLAGKTRIVDTATFVDFTLPNEELHKMSGPIVRSGPSPEFSKNWDSVFGKKPGKSAAKSAAAPAKKTAKKRKK